MPLRSTLVGATSGVLLLAGVFGFAVGLPEVEEPEIEPVSQEGADTTPVAQLLPETLLDGGVVGFEEVDPQLATLADEVEGYSTDRLSEAFGTEVAVGLYTTPQGDVQIAVTIYDGESGLFLQNGPPIPPEMSGGSNIVSDVVRSGDSVCIGQWQTQSFQQDAPPAQVQCQRVVSGRTVNVSGGPGLTIDQVADIVDDVVDQAGLA